MTNSGHQYRACAVAITTVSVLVCSSAGQAQENEDDDKGGFHASVAENLKYDSNVFRLPSGANTAATTSAGQRDDFISTTYLQLRFGKDFGRHQLNIMVAPNMVRYFEFNQFDYFGHDAFIDWVGRLGSDGHYGLRYEHLRTESNLADLAQPERNIVNTEIVGADLVVRTGSYLHVVTAWRGTRAHNSNTLEQGGDNHGWSGDAGLRLSKNGTDWADLRYRRSVYQYPNVIPSQLSDNSYQQNEVELSWNWMITEASRLEGRASHVRRSHEHFHERDFDGWVGDLKYTWRPTESTSVAAKAFREIGAVTDASASYARSYGASLTPDWQYSEKLGFSLPLEWRHRRYEGFSLIGRPDERTTTAGIGVTYKPARKLQLKLAANDEHRHSSDSARTYTVWTTALTARWDIE